MVARRYNQMLERIGRILPVGIGPAVRNLGWELGLAAIHSANRIRARRYKMQSDLKLHLGCGPRTKPGWVNIDLRKEADLNLDLRRRLPFASGSCSVIYSEHFLEHLDYPEPVAFFLKECHRVLKPGGIFNVAVPDIELVMRSYVLGGTEEYFEAQRKWGPAWCKTHMDYINYNFRQDDEHRFSYDVETLTALLQRCGFTDIRTREFDSTLDSAERQMGSLYMVCRRP
jgi:predicted SAM-dependent methyltransferase